MSETARLEKNPFKVRIHPVDAENTLAYADVTISDVFVVRGVRVMKGKEGPFISMPSYKKSNGDYRDICYPCSKAAKNTFYAAVLRAYDLALQAKQEEVANKLSSPRMGM